MNDMSYRMNSLGDPKIGGNSLNFNVHQLNLGYVNSHLCPRCNQSYTVFTRNNGYVGKVPLILNCYHTLCEECIASMIINHQIICCVCNKASLINNREKCNLQQIFPVNFYILGLMNYCKPNTTQSFGLKLKPAGVKYKDYIQSNPLNNFISDLDILKSRTREKCCQEGCLNVANLHCVECDELYCTTCCETLHKSARGLKTHKIASINDFAPRLTAKCSLHKELFLEVFCNTCKKISCCYCIVQDHKGHDFYKLSDLNMLGEFNLDELVVKAEEKLRRLLIAHKVGFLSYCIKFF
ncbi:hypothetical protein FQR65_LT04832 [Abscondita terminalis]|nr:hypothetical protein FQR65_LT04832 [Abscondita terminalis]